MLPITGMVTVYYTLKIYQKKDFCIAKVLDKPFAAGAQISKSRWILACFSYTSGGIVWHRSQRNTSSRLPLQINLIENLFSKDILYKASYILNFL